MKKWLFLIAMMYGSAVIAFETQKPVDCFPTLQMLNSLTKEFDEKIIFDSLNVMTGKSRVALFVNHRTGSWTLIEYDNDHACLLGVGRGKTT